MLFPACGLKPVSLLMCLCKMNTNFVCVLGLSFLPDFPCQRVGRTSHTSIYLYPCRELACEAAGASNYRGQKTQKIRCAPRCDTSCMKEAFYISHGKSRRRHAPTARSAQPVLYAVPAQCVCAACAGVWMRTRMASACKNFAKVCHVRTSPARLASLTALSLVCICDSGASMRHIRQFSYRYGLPIITFVPPTSLPRTRVCSRSIHPQPGCQRLHYHTHSTYGLAPRSGTSRAALHGGGVHHLSKSTRISDGHLGAAPQCQGIRVPTPLHIILSRIHRLRSRDQIPRHYLTHPIAAEGEGIQGRQSRQGSSQRQGQEEGMCMAV